MKGPARRSGQGIHSALQAHFPCHLDEECGHVPVLLFPRDWIGLACRNRRSDHPDLPGFKFQNDTPILVRVDLDVRVMWTSA